MELTREQLIESNSTLAEERRTLSDRLAEIEGIANDTTMSADDRVKLIQARYRTWNTPITSGDLSPVGAGPVINNSESSEE